MPTGKVTVTSKRCKNCVFWDYFNGTVDNSAMRKLYESNVPARRRHACQLVLRAAKNADGTFQEDANGDPVKVPLRGALFRATAADELGPMYGERTSPNDGCGFQTPKHPTFRKPSPIVGVIDQSVNLNDMAHRDLATPISGELETIHIRP